MLFGAFSLILVLFFIVLNRIILPSTRYHVGIIPEMVYPGSVITAIAILYYIKAIKRGAKVQSQDKKNGESGAYTLGDLSRKIAIGLLLAAYFWGYYFLFSFRYKFFVIYPLRAQDFFNALVRLAPFVVGRLIMQGEYYKGIVIPLENKEGKRGGKYWASVIVGMVIYVGLAGALTLIAPTIVVLQISLLIMIWGSLCGALLYHFMRSSAEVAAFELLLFAYVFSKCYLMF